MRLDKFLVSQFFSFQLASIVFYCVSTMHWWCEWDWDEKYFCQTSNGYIYTQQFIVVQSQICNYVTPKSGSRTRLSKSPFNISWNWQEKTIICHYFSQNNPFFSRKIHWLTENLVADFWITNNNLSLCHFVKTWYNSDVHYCKPDASRPMFAIFLPLSC